MQDLHKDLATQDTWLHALKPRNAMLKFDLPYRDGKNYSYVKGQLRIQVPWVQYMGALFILSKSMYTHTLTYSHSRPRMAQRSGCLSTLHHPSTCQDRTRATSTTQPCMTSACFITTAKCGSCTRAATARSRYVFVTDVLILYNGV